MRRVEPIGKILGELIRGLGFEKKLKEQRAVVEWSNIVGDRVAAHAQAVRVDRGRLLVEVDSSVWAQELSLMRRKILREVNERIGREAIETIHFVLGRTSPHGASSRNGSEKQGHD